MAAVQAERVATETLDVLVLDLLEWIGPAGRPYDEVIEAWRTSCPRLAVWEEATAAGLVACGSAPQGRGLFVTVTERGCDHLSDRRPTRDR